ncbi:LrgB family protein [Pseudohalioglobus lutimaris]|uniref:LrgB family protein n=1 Tax=Pseudohalioglobus lutimaris TaxID=1737061 RepID=A0A2N5X894_9GAMM|nr:LrgB family protein [Pseudohalioglobus lutimaris]PLW70696.1 LrgB family protein [Pseudohalioglobus lutimaris]
MTGELQTIWVYLAASPLLSLTLTLLAYTLGLWLHRRAGKNPLVNPVLFAMLVLVALLSATDTDYTTYFQGAQFVHFLLGPATVALAIPLYRQVRQVKDSAPAIIVAVFCGSITAALTAVGIAWALGATEPTLLSLAPKSATTPVAMGIAEQLGGLPSLTAAAVILTGIIGAMAGSSLLALLGVNDSRARGLAMGVASHGIGTARALQIDDVAGAFSGLAMGLNALATAVLVPILLRWLF